jgi:hypothetical protein
VQKPAGRSAGRPKRKKEYQEEPGWATGFQREDNRPPRPQFTGQGILDDEIVDAIMEAGGEFQIAIWTHDSDGRVLRNRNGSRRIRVHIEPPYEGGEADELEDDEDDDEDLEPDGELEDDDEDDNIPF